MLYFIKNREVIGKVKTMPPHQYDAYIKAGYERCDKNGEVFDIKGEQDGFAERATAIAKEKAAIAKKIAEAKKAEKAKKLAVIKEEIDRIKASKDKANADRIAELKDEIKKLAAE